METKLKLAEGWKSVALGKPAHAVRGGTASHHRDAKPRPHRRRDAVVTGTEVDDPAGPVQAVQGLQDAVAVDAGRRRHDQRQRALQVAVVIGAGDPDQRLGEEKHPARLFRFVMQRDDQVEFAVRLPAQQGLAEVARHLEHHVRMRLRERAQEFGQERGGVFMRRAETDAPGDIRLAHRGQRLVVQREDAARELRQRLALRRQLQAVGIPLEQLRIHDLFQPADLQADRRLGAADLLGGAREAAEVDRLHEGAQEFGRDVLNRITMSAADDMISIMNFPNVNGSVFCAPFERRPQVGATVAGEGGFASGGTARGTNGTRILEE